MPIDVDDHGELFPSAADWRVCIFQVQRDCVVTYPCDPRDTPALANLDDAALNMVE